MYDLIILNGRIVDGTGHDAYMADIGIKGEKIETIGNLHQEQALSVIDAKGKTVTPGFIEPHSHADMTVLFHPSMETYLMQGVTTVVSGNCGHGMAPMGKEVYRTAVDADMKATAALNPAFFDALPPLYVEQEKIRPLLKEYFNIELDWHSFEEYNEKCERLPIDCNIAPLVGHSAIRNTVMGMDCERAPSEAEMEEMEKLLRECMEQGAFGFSTGRDPTYVPSFYAKDEEIIRLLNIVKEYDGIFTSHTANFADGKFDGMAGFAEFLRQAEAAGVRANISHVQLPVEEEEPARAVSEARKLIAYFEEHEASGLDLSYDIIPVSDTSFVLCPYLASVFAPLVRMLGSRKWLSECLAAADFRKMVRALAESGMMPSIDTRNSDGIFGRFYVTENNESKKVIAAYAKERGLDPLEYAMVLLAENPDVQCGMSFQPCKEAYDLLIGHRMAMPCLDGSCVTKDTDYSLTPELPEYPAPFYYNGMARYLLQNGRPRFEDTIRQMTGFVAERFRIPNRGLLKEGCFADILILDLEHLRSYDMDWKNRTYPDGFDYVMVNGTITIDHKKHLGVAAGHVLKKTDTGASL